MSSRFGVGLCSNLTLKSWYRRKDTLLAPRGSGRVSIENQDLEMSSDQVSQWNIQDVIENLSASMTASYMVMACAKVEVIWGRKLTGATLLFILNRYIILLETLFVVLAFLLNWNSDLVLDSLQP
ncbi:hypothetical protein A0H81_05225 [Grifola frondosa]|uniref:Uncharacterized protein n=1 Tax=Grifola frondosa TaxID=5627 RepID=A0A1C7MDD4_GRIFR|nr:hypothetical protein A0H81_05225 [Grifola frondosa]